LDLLRPGLLVPDRAAARRLRAVAAHHVGREVRDRRHVLHAPQVRPQAVPRAVHGTADHRHGDAHLPPLPVREDQLHLITMAGAVPGLTLLLHTAATVGWTSFPVHASTVIGLALFAALYESAARHYGVALSVSR